jgi:hypothetical protein
MAITWNKNRCTDANPLRLLGNARKRNPDIVTKRWDLRAPDTFITELLRGHRVGNSVWPGRQSKCVSQHLGLLQIMKRHLVPNLPDVLGPKLV